MRELSVCIISPLLWYGISQTERESKVGVGSGPTGYVAVRDVPHCRLLAKYLSNEGAN